MLLLFFGPSWSWNGSFAFDGTKPVEGGTPNGGVSLPVTSASASHPVEGPSCPCARDGLPARRSLPRWIDTTPPIEDSPFLNGGRLIGWSIPRSRGKKSQKHAGAVRRGRRAGRAGQGNGERPPCATTVAQTALSAVSPIANRRGGGLASEVIVVRWPHAASFRGPVFTLRPLPQ